MPLSPRPSVWLLFPLVLGACASNPQESAPAKVEELVTWVERMHVECELSRQAVAAAYARLRTLAAADFRNEDVVTAYARYVQAIDAAEQQAKAFGATVGPVKAAGVPVFTQWQQDVNQIESETLRQKSQMRLAVTRERYDAILTVAEPAQQEFTALVRSLRDIALFLGHDMNTQALMDIQDDARAIATATEALDRKLEQSLRAARSYVDQAALPTGFAAAPARGSGR